MADEEKSFASDPQEPPQSPGPDPQSPGGADSQMDEPATPATPATPQTGGDGAAATPYTPLSATPSSQQGSLSQRWVTIHEVGVDARGGGGGRAGGVARQQ